MTIGTCPVCGVEVRWVTLDGERVPLDTIPSVDGRVRLDPENADKAERIAAPGHTGFKLHTETCPKGLRT